MKRYWTLAGTICFAFTVLFLAVEWLNPAFLADPQALTQQGRFSFAVIGTALLVADVLLPVPSSFVMITNGALFGILLGTVLSLLGYTAGGLIGFLIGRRSIGILRRLVPPEEQARANLLLREWGWLAIMVTRPLPLLAETTSIMAGASTMTWRNMIGSTLVGSLPIALLYAITGATAANLDSLLFAFALSVLIAGLFLMIGKYWRPNDRRSYRSKYTHARNKHV